LELRPLLLELLHGSLFIRNTFFDRFIHTGIEVKRLSAYRGGTRVRYRIWVQTSRHPHDELSTQARSSK